MTHSALLDQMKRLGLTDMEAMHELSEARLISDNCVRVWDIAQPDLTRCVQWLASKRIKWGSELNANEKVLV